jgi:hypothetical protein
VFGRLVDRLPNLRALLVVTFRPEFAAPWVGEAHVTLLPLSRFGRRDSLAMVDRVTGGEALPTEVLERIVAKTDGVPLFVEERPRRFLGPPCCANGALCPGLGADAARDPLDPARFAHGAA